MLRCCKYENSINIIDWYSLNEGSEMILFNVLLEYEDFINTNESIVHPQLCSEYDTCNENTLKPYGFDICILFLRETYLHLLRISESINIYSDNGLYADHHATLIGTLCLLCGNCIYVNHLVGSVGL